MLYFLGFIFGIISYTNAKSFYVPDNINFVTRFYDNSSKYAIHNQTLKTMCYDTIERDGHPRCCYGLLKGINVFNNTRNMTFGDMFGTLDGRMVSYDCETTNFHEISVGEIFTWIGLIFTAILGIAFVIYLLVKMYICFCRRSDYYSIN